MAGLLMQDRYFGDIGDFAKYGLLRGLAQDDGKPLRFGIVWYRVPNESHNADGRHTAYLDDTNTKNLQYRNCDSELYGELRRALRKTRRRSVDRVFEYKILPANTASHHQYLSFEGLKTIDRGPRRNAWIESGIRAMESADVVLMDPDNGLETKIRSTARKGPKYAYYDELKAFRDQGKSLIVYQHVCRTCSAEEQLQLRFHQIAERLRAKKIWALWFRRASARFFFVIPRDEHARQLANRCDRFLAGPWSRLFQRAAPDTAPPSPPADLRWQGSADTQGFS